MGSRQKLSPLGAEEVQHLDQALTADDIMSLAPSDILASRVFSRST